MSEILLSSKFAGSGGAANDSTSCTAAFSAAGADVIAAEGGTIVFDAAGICRLTGKTQIQPYADVRIKGHGDSAVRFMAQSDRHISLSSQQRTSQFDGFIGVGQGTGNSSTGQPTIVCAGGGISRWVDTSIIGVGAADSVCHFENVNADVCGCNFSGCAATTTGVLHFYQWRAAAVRNCNFLDYSTHAGVLYSKTPGGSTSWIYLNSPITPQNDATDTNNFTCENCAFDEGANAPVLMYGGTSAKITGCTVNIGAGQGFYFEGVQTVLIENTFVGYSTSGSKKGVTLKDVNFAKLTGLTLGQDVDYIEIAGTTREVVIEGGNLNVGHNATYPTSIYNPAGARVTVNGVRVKGTITQIGG